MKRLILALAACLVTYHGPIGASSSTYYSEPLPSIQTVSYARDMQGKDPVPALEGITGKPAHQILSDLHHYVHRDRFVTAVLDGKWDQHRPAPESRPATKYESGMALASLLDAMGRREEARAIYSALAAGGSESRN